jgi:hypothetical protein
LITFADAKSELRKLGISLIMAPAEYVVYKRGSSLDAFRTDDLAAAVEHGRQLAVISSALRDLPPLGPMGRKSRRGQMYAHNRKIAARRRKQEA